MLSRSRMNACFGRACARLIAALLFIVGATTGANAHTVSLGYTVAANGVVTIYYGGYHPGVAPEGDITINRIGGGYSATKPASVIHATRPPGLVDGTNNFAPASCTSGSLQPSVIWESATFTGVPSGQYTIQLTGSFTINWSPCSTSISSPTSIFVIDASPPVLSGMPANITASAPAGGGPAVVTWTPPVASDDIGVASFTTTYPPGSSFPIGTTTVTYTVTDTSGIVTTASFTVTVVDTTPPVITGMPADVTISLPVNGGPAVATWPIPSATDNVGVTSFTSSHASGATFPVGVTTVTYTALDAAGNKVETTFNVTVVDTTGPVVGTCPANQTLEATEPGGAPATWSAPTASDNSGSAITPVGSHISGELFPLGSTSVAYTATDPSGNVATPCIFTITVRDTTGPVLAPISNIVVVAPGTGGAIVTFAPTATDAAGGQPTITTSPASGTTFAVGTHTITVTATDAAGNQSQTTFTITVQAPAQMGVTPGTDFMSQGPQGQQGGVFAPTSNSYTVSNTGEEAMAYTVTGMPAWLSVAPATGNIPAGGSTTITVALTSAANGLTAGDYTAPLLFTNTTTNIGTTTRSARLIVQAPANMAVTPAIAFVSSGPQGQQGGGFSPSSTTYTVQNTGTLPMAFTVSGQPSWANVSPSSGTVPAGGSQVVTVALNSNAAVLAVGAQTATLVFTNATNGMGSTTRGMTLTIVEPARLVVTPPEGLAVTGFQGGPFAPSSKVYTLTNAGGMPLTFTASNDKTWLDASPASGTIPAGGSTTVALRLAAAANALPAGSHTGTLTLANTSNGIGSTTRPATLRATANGQVVLRVVSTDGDGAFRFTSATTGLNVTVNTTGGSGQSTPITLNPATYTTVLTPPDGFGLTAVGCSDTDSTGNVGAKSATIVLSTAELLTCTFASVNSRKKTVEVISTFMNRRNDMLLNNGPDERRQIDRLIEAETATKNGASTGAADQRRTTDRPGLEGEGSPLGARSPGAPAGANRAFGDGLRRANLGADVGATDAQRQPSLSPLTAGGSAGDGPTRASFGTSLGQMMRFNTEAAERKAQGASEAAIANGAPLRMPTPKAHFTPWDFWVQGQYISFKDTRDTGKADGHFATLQAGVDYVFNPRLLVGVYAGLDSMRQSSAAAGYDIKGRGWMVGPYATARLTDNIFLQARAAVGRSNNTVSPYQTYSDDFTSTRMMASATLTGRWQFGDWQLRPSATISYIEDKSQSYVDSLGVTIPSLKAALGQMKVGPEVSYRIQLKDGSYIEPRAGLQLLWNFAGTTQPIDFGDSLNGPGGLRGKADLGLKMQFTTGASLDLSTSYDGIGSKGYSAIGGKATVRIPLN